MIAVSEKVLELAGLMKAEAETAAVYNPGAAEGLKLWAGRFEAVVQAEEPEWVSLAEVRALRGWSVRYLRALAQRLEQHDGARKNARGVWEFRIAAVRTIPPKPAHLREIRTEADLEELGRQLGAEG